MLGSLMVLSASGVRRLQNPRFDRAVATVVVASSETWCTPWARARLGIQSGVAEAGRGDDPDGAAHFNE
jgi:hypothetical protein